MFIYIYVLYIQQYHMMDLPLQDDLNYMYMLTCEWMRVWLTQHAHPQHEGIHGVGQTPGSPSCTWREHHLLGLGLLTFYLCGDTSKHRQTISVCRVHNQTDLTGLPTLFKVVFYLTCTVLDAFHRGRNKTESIRAPRILEESLEGKLTIMLLSH